MRREQHISAHVRKSKGGEARKKSSRRRNRARRFVKRRKMNNRQTKTWFLFLANMYFVDKKAAACRALSPDSCDLPLCMLLRLGWASYKCFFSGHLLCIFVVEH